MLSVRIRLIKNENTMIPFFFTGEKGKTVDLKATLQGDLVTLTLTTHSWGSKVN